ncbi:MAG: maltose ABC transporter substrate-binding protein [Propionibacteriaceae bacterium]|nr:maltose ABC transporter substrate-binding protein [Propionibacteriaceae bacterium]
MKKSLVLGIGAVVTALLLASCGNGGGATTDGTDTIVLTVSESLQGPDEFIKQAGAAYTAQNPNVTIEFVNIETDKAQERITVDGPAGTGPDVFAVPHDQLGKLIAGGHVLPATGSMSGNVLQSNIDAVTHDGKIYGYPVGTETYALFYNKALVPDIDQMKTWDGLIEWCETYQAENPGKYGFAMDIANAFFAVLFTTAHGNKVFGPDGTDETNTYLNSADALVGMATYQKLSTVLKASAADLDSATTDGLFMSGDAAMTITGPWNINNYSDAGIDYGIVPLPALPGDTNPAGSFMNARTMAVSAYSKNPDAAQAFAAFLTTPEMQQLRADLTGAMAPATSDIDYGANTDKIQGIVDQAEFAYATPSISAMPAFWEPAKAAFSNIWGGADAQTELDKANAAIVGQ